MKIHTLNLYEYYGITPGPGAKGTLTCYCTPVSTELTTIRKRPMILVIPGGGYSRVSQREGEPIALRFLTMGYSAFVLEYTCAPAMFPVALQEAAMAMKYIRSHAEEYEGNPDMVAAVGFSAGGHLCGTLGTLYDHPAVAQIAPAHVVRPDALGLSYPVMLSYGPTHEGTMNNISGNDPQLRHQLSIDKLVRPDMPPVFLWHTRDDTVVPVRNSILTAAALDEAGVDFALHIYRKGVHGLATADDLVFTKEGMSDMSWDAPGWLDAMGKFFADCGFEVQDRAMEGHTLKGYRP